MDGVQAGSWEPMTDLVVAVAAYAVRRGMALQIPRQSFSAKEVLAGGGTVMYQGGTGNVRFDANGDVSAPAVVWSFAESGIEEVEYLSLDEVDDFIASLK